MLTAAAAVRYKGSCRESEILIVYPHMRPSDTIVIINEDTGVRHGSRRYNNWPTQMSSCGFAIRISKHVPHALVKEIVKIYELQRQVFKLADPDYETSKPGKYYNATYFGLSERAFLFPSLLSCLEIVASYLAF